jgi:hypothetical protein
MDFVAKENVDLFIIKSIRKGDLKRLRSLVREHKKDLSKPLAYFTWSCSWQNDNAVGASHRFNLLVNVNPLIYALNKCTEVEVIRYLLNNGCSLRTALQGCMVNENDKAESPAAIDKKICSDYEHKLESTIMNVFFKHNNNNAKIREEVMLLVEYGIRGIADATIIECCCQTGDIDLLRYLVSSGFCINTHKQFLGVKYRISPIRLALVQSPMQFDFIKEMLNLGYDVNSEDAKWILHGAANLKVVELLVNHGLCLSSVPSMPNNTPWLLERGKYKLVGFYISLGIPINSFLNKRYDYANFDKSELLFNKIIRETRRLKTGGAESSKWYKKREFQFAFRPKYSGKEWSCNVSFDFTLLGYGMHENSSLPPDKRMWLVNSGAVPLMDVY